MVKAFKESHEKDVETLPTDRRCETESRETHALTNDPKHNVLCMTDYWKTQFLTSRMTTSGRKTYFNIDMISCQGTLMSTKPAYPDVVRMRRQFHGCPASGGGIERVFTSRVNWKTA